MTAGLPADMLNVLDAAVRAKGLRQDDLAALVGVDQSMVSHILRGTRIPGRAVARGLARELGLDDECGAQLVAYCDAHASAS